MPEYVPYSAFWFTLSVINAGLAQSKGRSGLRWGLLSLFIGPLATLFIVAWPAIQPGVPEPWEGPLSQTQATVVGLLAVVAVVVILGLLAYALGAFGQSG
jgi:hypothetical protein